MFEVREAVLLDSNKDNPLEFYPQTIWFGSEKLSDCMHYISDSYAQYEMIPDEETYKWTVVKDKTKTVVWIERRYNG